MFALSDKSWLLPGAPTAVCPEPSLFAASPIRRNAHELRKLLPMPWMRAALADTDVDVHFGVPFYTYQVTPRYVYYEDYGWYDPYRYPRFRRIFTPPCYSLADIPFC